MSWKDILRAGTLNFSANNERFSITWNKIASKLLYD